AGHAFAEESRPQLRSLYVLAGELACRVGEEELGAPAGAFLQGPAGETHTLVVGDQPARVLDVLTPRSPRSGLRGRRIPLGRRGPSVGRADVAPSAGRATTKRKGTLPRELSSWASCPPPSSGSWSPSPPPALSRCPRRRPRR